MGRVGHAIDLPRTTTRRSEAELEEGLSGCLAGLLSNQRAVWRCQADELPHERSCNQDAARGGSVAATGRTDDGRCEPCCCRVVSDLEIPSTFLGRRPSCSRCCGCWLRTDGCPKPEVVAQLHDMLNAGLVRMARHDDGRPRIWRRSWPTATALSYLANPNRTRTHPTDVWRDQPDASTPLCAATSCKV